MSPLKLPTVAICAWTKFNDPISPLMIAKLPNLFLIDCIISFPAFPVPQHRGRDYSRSSTGTGMPSQERFQHAPPGACFESCPASEITSFVEDSSRSRRLSFGFCFYIRFGIVCATMLIYVTATALTRLFRLLFAYSAARP